MVHYSALSLFTVLGTPFTRRQNIKIASGVSKEVKLIESSAKAQTDNNVVISKPKPKPKTEPQRHKSQPKIKTTKRVGYLYPKVYDLDNLKLAHKNAQKGKGWYREVKMINEDMETYLKEAQKLLINKTYDTSPYEVFLKKDYDKVREIYKLPYFPDRVVQWALLQVIEPYLINTIITDTYSAIPNRGIHLALKRIRKAIRTDPEGTKYCFKMDVTKYYPSIRHELLKEKYRKLFKDADLLWLIDEIIDSTDGDVGVPIGNYMSQWSGNYFLSEFDHWMKEVKRVKHYYRYMDDIVVLAGSKEELHQLERDIEEFLMTRMSLRMKGNHQVFPVKDRGIDFLGYRIFPDYVLLRKSTAKNMKRRVAEINATIEKEGQMTFSQWCSINSYKGWLMYCDSYRLTQKYIAPLEPYADKFYKEVILNGKVA